jgi:hypothetical protein
MNRILGIVLAFLAAFTLWQSPALAQIGGKGLDGIVVAACGTAPTAYPPAGLPASLTIATNGELCTNASGGGGGGAVTLASGAVAAGAYSAGAFAAGSGADGWDVDEGTLAATAWTSGNGSIIAILKAISGSATTTATNTGAAIPTQAPTVSIGGVGIVDSAGTNVATVKAASTLPVAADKTLVVGLNPGSATAGSPTGAIVTVQGVSGGQAIPISGALTANQSVNLAQINATSTASLMVAASTAPVTATNPALTVDLRPDSPGIIPLGQAVKASSVPVTFASDQDPCSYAQKSSVKIAITTATTTAMVAVSGSTTVYVCGFDFTISNVVTTANTLKFESGTGTACATPVADLTGIYNAGGVTAAAPTHVQSAGTGGGTVFNGGASNGVCAVTAIGATAAFEGVLTFVQQ